MAIPTTFHGRILVTLAALALASTLLSTLLTGAWADTPVSAHGAGEVNPAVATPRSVLGYSPGDDYKLDSWNELTRFYEQLAATSDRVHLEKLGKTTEGREYLLAIISSPENLKHLKKYQEINLKLTDPRRFQGGDAEAERLVQQGKTVVALTFGIHSSEVASYLSGQLVAYRLASANDEETKRILDNTIILLVPALNPDGVDIIKTWYDKRLAASSAPGTANVRLPQPLYHKYIGHDDNRDWVGFTQVETRITVDKVLNPWHPQILHDVHQQGANGPRISLPPYTLPVEPNIPRQIVQGYTELGLAIADDLHNQGFTGVITGAAGSEGYDAWSPLRQYAHFHNGVRILSETAAADIASPITLAADRVRPNKPLPNFHDPWAGGNWTIGMATTYVQAAAFSLLDHAATDREKWLHTSYEIAKEAVRARGVGELSAYLIPASANRAALLTILHHGGVEVQYLTKELKIGSGNYPAGTALIRLDQPYGGFANAVLSRQQYPNLRDAAGNPIRPYDVTAHTLPLLLDVNVVAVEGPLHFHANAHLAKSDTNASVHVAKLPAVPSTVRVGLIKTNAVDEGWDRWVLEQNGVHYTLLEPAALDVGDLRTHYDVLLLPNSFTGIGRRSAAPRTSGGQDGSSSLPVASQGEGAEALKQFVNAGGTVIALNRASDFAITALNLPVKDVTLGFSRNDYYSPGSILRTVLDTSNPITQGLAPESIAWAENSPAFELTAAAQLGQVSIIAHYLDSADPLLSGWLLGCDKLKGKAALVEVKSGAGRVILFGFEPEYRGLALATYPLLFNAITTSVAPPTAPK